MIGIQQVGVLFIMGSCRPVAWPTGSPQEGVTREVVAKDKCFEVFSCRTKCTLGCLYAVIVCLNLRLAAPGLKVKVGHR